MQFVTISCMEADGLHYGPDGAGAVYSDEPTPLYRFRLWRTWDRSKPIAMFDMLNPSTATHLKLDATLRRTKAYAIAWGFGGFEVGNLFAWRATDPKDMKAASDPVGPGNDELLLERGRQIVAEGGVVVAGWGTHGVYKGRCHVVRTMFRIAGVKLHYVRLSKDGHPCHPLYLPKDLQPTEWV